MRHGVLRIGRKIEHYGFHLVDIRPDPAGIGMEVGPQLDMFADEATEHSFHIADELNDFDRFGPDHLATAECQQLRNQFARPVPALRISPAWLTAYGLPRKFSTSIAL